MNSKMPTNCAPSSIKVDDEGYMIEPGEWNEDLAKILASEEDLELSVDHWKIIKFMRDHYNDHLTTPDSRVVIKYLADELSYGKDAKKQLFILFPYGYVQQACKIAGMKRPRAWSTG